MSENIKCCWFFDKLSVDFSCYCLCIAPQERMQRGGAS